MAYDALDRLTDAGSVVFGGDHWHRFTYDALDNLRSWKLAGVKDYGNYTYDANNRLTTIKNTGGSNLHTLAYDVQGNLSGKDGASFQFDFGNRLRTAIAPGGTESYRYDGHGRRVLAWTAAGSKLTMYSAGGQVMYQHSDPQAKTTENIYLGGSLVASREKPFSSGHVVKYQHTDALGSPVAMSNQAGAVIERTNYDPYGGAINKTVDGIGYTGHVMDPVTGLTYMQQRYYDPKIGRFLSVDPVTEDSVTGGNFSRYWYANNNTYKFTDPDGRFSRPTWPSTCELANACLSGGQSRSRASQDRQYADAQQNSSSRQQMIDRMHEASGASGPSPQYDPNLLNDAGAVDTINGLMTVGPSAFDYENAADLGSVIFHERIHRLQFRDFSDFHVMAQDNRDHVLEFEAHSRTLSQENPFRSRMSNLYRTTAEAALQGHVGAMNATNRAIVLSGGTCATNYCSGGR